MIPPTLSEVFSSRGSAKVKGRKIIRCAVVMKYMIPQDPFRLGGEHMKI